MEPVLAPRHLAPRHRGTASAMRRSRGITSLIKAGVVEEEDVMGWGWLMTFVLVELVDEWIYGSISLVPELVLRRRGTMSATKRSWAVMELKKARVVEEEGMGHGEVDIDID